MSQEGAGRRFLGDADLPQTDREAIAMETGSRGLRYPPLLGPDDCG